MLATIFAFFNISDIRIALRMTLNEFQLRYKAHLMQTLDREREIYLQAFLNRMAKATDAKGKYLYPAFKDFYQGEKHWNELLYGEKENEIDKELIRRARRLQEFRKKGESE